MAKRNFIGEAELLERLQDLAKAFQVDNGYDDVQIKDKWSEGQLTISITLVTPGANDRKSEEFDSFAVRRGLPQGLFGQTYIDKGKRYTITGVNPRARKAQVLMRREDGKSFKCDWLYLKMHLSNNGII